MSKRTILDIASALIVVLGWWSCHRGGSSNPAQLSGEKDGKGHNAAGAGGAAVPIVTGKAQQKDMPVYLDGLGTVRAERGSVSTHLVFSAICVRGDVVIASAPPNEIAQITRVPYRKFLPLRISTVPSCSYRSLMDETTTVEARL
jgi:hypothetical protein